MIFPILSAILGILAFLPFDYFWPFGFFYLVPLFIFFAKENKFWRLIWGTLIFRTILCLGTVYYTLEPIVWTQSIGIFIGLPISIFIIKRGLKNQLSTVKCQMSIVALLPFLWTFFDHLQARFSLLPTYIITAGNIFGSSPFLGLSSFGGLIFLTFFAAIINALIVAAYKNLASINRSKIFLAIIAIIFLGWGISKIQINKNASDYNLLPETIKIASVSTNKNFYYSDLEKIKDKIINSEIDFLILPEDIFNNAPTELDIKFWRDFAQKINVNLLVTGDHRENNKRYNSSVLIDKNNEIIDIHNKNRLTFIGEYWPFGKWVPPHINWLKKTQPEIKNYAVFNFKNAYSAGNQKLLTAKLKSKELKLASLICLEIHYLRDLKNYKKMGAQLFVNPTSNRWLDLGLYHFLYLTNNLRKIESVWLKTPIILSGVKDYAGIITPDGKIQSVNFENKNNAKNYEIFIGEIKI